MANASYICLFFLLMIFSYELTCIDGRNLKVSKELKCVKCLNPDAKIMAGETTGDQNTTQTQSPTPGHVESFRPTTPGHSPGVGHSIHN